MANEKPVVGDHKWPESVDFDQHGNLYFTDAIEKALFQIKRNHNGTLDNKSIPLLLGFDHTSGVSVDRKNAFLYLGTKVNRAGKILKIPLRLFEIQTSIDYRSFRWDSLNDLSLQPEELDIECKGTYRRAATPNGVVFNRKANHVFYTDSTIPESLLFGGKGFIGNTNDLFQRELITPNGIDLDPTSENALVVSLLRKNCVLHLDLVSGKETSSPVFGTWLDGLLCLENGDILVAAFRSRRIFHLSRNKNEFIDPCVISELSDCPTDLAIGPSSDGMGESLFVTTTGGILRFLWRGGKVVEIPHIRDLIRSK